MNLLQYHNKRILLKLSLRDRVFVRIKIIFIDMTLGCPFFHWTKHMVLYDKTVQSNVKRDTENKTRIFTGINSFSFNPHHYIPQRLKLFEYFILLMDDGNNGFCDI